MKDETLAKIKNGAQFGLAVKYKEIASEEVHLLCQQQPEKIKSYFNSEWDVQNAFLSLAQPERDILFDTIYQDLPRKIKNAEAASIAMQSFTPLQCKEFITLMVEKKSKLFTKPNHIQEVLSFLNAEQIEPVISTILEKNPTALATTKDIHDVLSDLLPYQCDKLLDAIQPILEKLIKNDDDLLSMKEGLSLKQHDLVIKKIPETIVSKISPNHRILFFPSETQNREETASQALKAKRPGLEK